MPAPLTLLDLLVRSMRAATKVDLDNEIAPAALLWLDPAWEWEPLLPRLRGKLTVLTLGDYHLEERSGPAAWLRCVLAGSLPNYRLAPNAIPVIYMPGVGPETLCQPENRPAELNPLADLMFRSVFWWKAEQQPWMVADFLQDAQHGPGAQVRDDGFTRKAMLRALPRLSNLTVDELRAEGLWKVRDFEALNEGGTADLVAMGESASLEFKSSSRWDMEKNCKNTGLEQVIIKTVAGYLNSERGGTLLIGVEDNKHVCGIEMDYPAFSKPEDRNTDAYERFINTLVLGSVGKEFAPQVHINFATVNERTICQVDVDQAPEPAFALDPLKKEYIFYLRVGNATNQLDVKAFLNYYRTRWGSRAVGRVASIG